jgi:hypothetical protein
MTTIKESSWDHLTLVHVFHAIYTLDYPWVSHALSLLSSKRYGRVSSNSATEEATQFGDPKKSHMRQSIIKGCSFGPNRADRNRHRRGLPPWSSEFMIQTTLNLLIQYSPLSLNCPARSQFLPAFPKIHLNHIEPPKKGGLSRVAINHSASTDSLLN